MSYTRLDQDWSQSKRLHNRKLIKELEFDRTAKAIESQIWIRDEYAEYRDRCIYEGDIMCFAYQECVDSTNIYIDLLYDRLLWSV